MDQFAVRAALRFLAAKPTTVAFELALEHARGHLRAELRLLDGLATVGREPVRLRACG